MTEDKKILVILTPAFAGSTTETTWLPPMQVFVKALNRNFPGLKIIILSFHYPVLAAPNYSWNGNDVTTFSAKQPRGFKHVLLWLRVWKKLKQLNKQYEIAGLLSLWCAECALVGKYFAAAHSLKHFIWISGQDARCNNKYIKLIKPRPGDLVAMSHFLVREFSKNHAITPAHVIPLGVDATMFMPGNTNRDIDIMGAGSLIPLKQYDVFIKVVQQLAVNRPGIKGVICGGGPEEAKLLAMLRDAGLQNNITFCGELPHAQVLAYMQRSKVFLHPSSYEGFGAVNLEALYAGAHVISFVKPMDEEIPHWHIVTTQQQMAQTAEALLQNPFTDYSAVLPYLINDVARQMMALFGL